MPRRSNNWTQADLDGLSAKKAGAPAKAEAKVESARTRGQKNKGVAKTPALARIGKCFQKAR
jgi:hypothetical protein